MKKDTEKKMNRNDQHTPTLFYRKFSARVWTSLFATWLFIGIIGIVIVGIVIVAMKIINKKNKK